MIIRFYLKTHWDQFNPVVPINKKKKKKKKEKKERKQYEQSKYKFIFFLGIIFSANNHRNQNPTNQAKVVWVSRLDKGPFLIDLSLDGDHADLENQVFAGGSDPGDGTTTWTMHGPESRRAQRSYAKRSFPWLSWNRWRGSCPAGEWSCSRRRAQPRSRRRSCLWSGHWLRRVRVRLGNHSWWAQCGYLLHWLPRKWEKIEKKRKENIFLFEFLIELLLQMCLRENF